MTSAVDYRNGVEYVDASWADDYYAQAGPGPATYPELRRGRPVYLSGVNTAGLAELDAQGADVGLLLQPGNGTNAQAHRYRVWAADNGCFAEAQGKPWSVDKWFGWLKGLAVDADLRWGNWGTDHLSRTMGYAGELEPRGCLFATAPDVVGDAAATWDRSSPWFAPIRELGLPVALVAQDGIEELPHPWDESERWDALFVGGSTEWKLSNEARDVVREAQALGKWVHVGRVNSGKRLRLAASWDADSADGTFLGFAPTENLGRLARWLDELAGDPVAPAPTWLEELLAALERPEALTLFA